MKARLMLLVCLQRLQARTSALMKEILRQLCVSFVKLKLQLCFAPNVHCTCARPVVMLICITPQNLRITNGVLLAKKSSQNRWRALCRRHQKHKLKTKTICQTLKMMLKSGNFLNLTLLVMKMARLPEATR